jgi:hypothetical protein
MVVEIDFLRWFSQNLLNIFAKLRILPSGMMIFAPQS